MKKRYRLKLIPPALGGVVGIALKLFPNALTFVGYPTSEQLEFVVAASGILGAFGVGVEVAAE